MCGQRTSLLRSAAASLASTRAAMSSAGKSCLSRRIFSRLGSGERAGGDPKGPGVSGSSMPPWRSSSSRCGLSDEPRSNETPRSRFSFLPWIASLSAAGARTRTGTPTGAMSKRRLRVDAVGAPKGLPRGRDVQVGSGFIATRVKILDAISVARSRSRWICRANRSQLGRIRDLGAIPGFANRGTRLCRWLGAWISSISGKMPSRWPRCAPLILARCSRRRPRLSAPRRRRRRRRRVFGRVPASTSPVPFAPALAPGGAAASRAPARSSTRSTRSPPMILCSGGRCASPSRFSGACSRGCWG